MQIMRAKGTKPLRAKVEREEPPAPEFTVFIENVPDGVGKDDISSAFKQFGEIQCGSEGAGGLM